MIEQAIAPADRGANNHDCVPAVAIVRRALIGQAIAPADRGANNHCCIPANAIVRRA